MMRRLMLRLWMKALSTSRQKTAIRSVGQIFKLSWIQLKDEYKHTKRDQNESEGINMDGASKSKVGRGADDMETVPVF